MMNTKLRSLPFIGHLIRQLNNQTARDNFVQQQLKNLPEKSLLLDAGCGSQRYRENCQHLIYKAQDFAQYTVDDKRSMGSDGVGGTSGYQYGKIDYVGDIWEIDENPNTFDSILCTEVFEHIPYPIETVKEFSRLLKSGGSLILTAPSNCLRHMDPYFFYSGFTDRWYEKILKENGFEIIVLEPVGDYYSWLSVEIARTAANHSIFAKILLLPTFLYYRFKKKTVSSTDTLCMGYHVLAKKV